MPSQLRLRAIASDAAAARRVAPPRPSGIHATTTSPAAQTREAMRRIQDALDGRRADPGSLLSNPITVDVIAADDFAGDEPVGVGRASKRARAERTEGMTEFPVVITGPERLGQPDNAILNKRDGRTKIYIRGFEFTRSTITSVKISYRCSFYRSQSCPAKLEFYASTMDYDFLNMIEHTCTPPSKRIAALDEVSKTVIVKASMEREVDALAVASADSPQTIWDKVSRQYYDRDDNVIVRGLSKAQVTNRVHRTRALHFGSNVHGRVEVPPLSRVEQSWCQEREQDRSRYRLGTPVSPQPAPLQQDLSVCRRNVSLCPSPLPPVCCGDGLRPRQQALRAGVLRPRGLEDFRWNILQYVSDACGQKIDPKQVVCDFEVALINAVGDWYADADIVG